MSLLVNKFLVKISRKYGSLPPWKLAEGGEGHSDGGVDVAARDLRAEQQPEDSSDTPPAVRGEDEG